MSWTSCNKPKGMSLEEFFKKEFPSIVFLGTYTANPREFYAAAYFKSRPEKIFGLVILCEYTRSARYNFSYKEMTEEVGPAYHNCPAKLLELLSPTSNELALEWRARCKANQAVQVKAKTESKQVQPGTVIRFKDGYRFSDYKGIEFKTFRRMNDKQIGRKNVFERIDEHGTPLRGLVRLPTKWAASDFAVIGMGDVEFETIEGIF